MGYGPTSLVWGYQCTAIVLLRISSHYKLCFFMRVIQVYSFGSSHP